MGTQVFLLYAGGKLDGVFDREGVEKALADTLSKGQMRKLRKDKSIKLGEDKTISYHEIPMPDEVKDWMATSFRDGVTWERERLWHLLCFFRDSILDEERGLGLKNSQTPILEAFGELLLDEGETSPWKYYLKGNAKGRPIEASKQAALAKAKAAQGPGDPVPQKPTCDCVPGPDPVGAVAMAVGTPEGLTVVEGTVTAAPEGHQAEHIRIAAENGLDITKAVAYAGSRTCPGCDNRMEYSASLHMICCAHTTCSKFRKFQTIPESAGIQDPLAARRAERAEISGPPKALPPARQFCPECSHEMPVSTVSSLMYVCQNRLCKKYLAIQTLRHLNAAREAKANPVVDPADGDRKCSGCGELCNECRINGLRTWYCANKSCTRCIHHPIKGDAPTDTKLPVD